jgi:hypothetical protein
MSEDENQQTLFYRLAYTALRGESLNCYTSFRRRLARPAIRPSTICRRKCQPLNITWFLDLN